MALFCIKITEYLVCMKNAELLCGLQQLYVTRVVPFYWIQAFWIIHEFYHLTF